MSLTVSAPTTHRASDADYATAADLQRKMEDVLNRLDAEADNYANARQISDFMSDRRKCALADAIGAIMDKDPELSATMAEHRARSSDGYKKKMKELIHDQLKAETAIANWNVLNTRLDVQRSWLALERSKIERL